MSKILVTGGAGYVGVELVHELCKKGYEVTVYDLFWYCDESVFNEVDVKIIKADIRDLDTFKASCYGIDTVIHLACISNDPSYYLNPEFSKTINFDCFEGLVQSAKEAGVSRFIYASSSSVYGVKEESNVHEGLSLEPLTDYSKYKALCEDILLKYASNDFIVSILRPATVCGLSRRQRLDVVVNILTNHAINTGCIKVFGGKQKRPNIHIKDMVRAYLHLLDMPTDKIQKKIFNVNGQNHTVEKLAEIIGNICEVDQVETVATDDNRSYHISSELIEKELGFKPLYSIEDAVKELAQALKEGKLPNSMDDLKYFNVKFVKTYLENENRN